jgi:hypothetical protein
MIRRGGMMHSLAAFVKVGLFIIIPTIAGLLAGIRLDTDETVLWTVMLTTFGFIIGSLLAWYSIRVEMKH